MERRLPFILLTFCCWDLMFDTNKMYILCIESPFQKCKVDHSPWRKGMLGCAVATTRLFPLQQAVGRGANGAERSSILDVLSDDYQLSLTYDDLCHDAMPVSILFPTFSAELSNLHRQTLVRSFAQGRVQLGAWLHCCGRKQNWVMSHARARNHES